MKEPWGPGPGLPIVPHGMAVPLPGLPTTAIAAAVGGLAQVSEAPAPLAKAFPVGCRAFSLSNAACFIIPWAAFDKQNALQLMEIALRK